MKPTRTDESRRELLAGVRGRSDEIRQAVVGRIQSIDAEVRANDPEYRDGLRQAIEASIAYTIDALEAPDDRPGPLPEPLASQARLAARRRIPVETMLRRYLAGHTVLGDFVLTEAERNGLPLPVLKKLLRSQAAATDRALAKISAIYVEEADAVRPRSTSRRRDEQVRRLLAGEMVDDSLLEYEFDRWHIGVVTRGRKKVDGIEAALAGFDARRLTVGDGAGDVWIWLGTQERLRSDRLQEAIPTVPPEGIRVGIGEPAWGRQGWRVSHEQARAALSLTGAGIGSTLRYAPVALLASAASDELLSGSLRQLYLDPLRDSKDEGEVLKETLRAYFGAEQSVTSTAATLGISRNTVRNRLRLIEEKLECVLAARAPDLITALRLSELRAD